MVTLSDKQYIALLENTLRFYADEIQYENVQIGMSYISPVQMDSGERARKAINRDISEETKKLL